MRLKNLPTINSKEETELLQEINRGLPIKEQNQLCEYCKSPANYSLKLENTRQINRLL